MPKVKQISDDDFEILRRMAQAAHDGDKGWMFRASIHPAQIKRMEKLGLIRFAPPYTDTEEITERGLEVYKNDGKL